MIRLSRFALGPMRQRTCITLHHAAQLHPHRRTCNRLYASSVIRVCIRIRGILGPHVIMVITSTIGSSALATHEPSIHAAYMFCIVSTLARPCSAEYFRMRSRDEGVIPRDLYGPSNRVRAIESQGHGCKVCIRVGITGFRESSLASLLNDAATC